GVKNLLTGIVALTVAVGCAVAQAGETVRAREREARSSHRTPPRESLARKLIRRKPFTRKFHGYRNFPLCDHKPLFVDDGLTRRLPPLRPCAFLFIQRMQRTEPECDITM